MSRKADVILIEKWPKWKDEQLGSFFRRLNTDEIQKRIKFISEPQPFSLGGKSSVIKFSETELFGYEDYLYEQHLNLIEQHEIYKLLMTSAKFKDLIAWVSNRKEFEYGKPKIKIKIIYLVTVILSDYSEKLQKNNKKNENGERIKKIHSLAKKLKKELESYDASNNFTIQDCISHTVAGLDYLCMHKAGRSERLDSTYKERALLEDMILWLKYQDLPIMPALIKRVLDIADTPNLGANDRRLRELIQVYKTRSKLRAKQHTAWLLMKGAGK